MLNDAPGAPLSVVFPQPWGICGQRLANASRVPIWGRVPRWFVCIKAVLLLKYGELTRLGDGFTAQLVPPANDLGNRYVAPTPPARA